MSVKQHLVPISFHLRNFNKYIKLDLKASQTGNITFIGENAVGKTTLANCFFPMLIDGSISTPSFNPAKAIDKLNQNSNPRNSARDTRNFESMLLGWGSGAMKVRTGYSYFKLKSINREVILGIGATRVVGDSKKPTWWFIVINQESTEEISLITTDTNGNGLSKDEFLIANKKLQDKLLIFDRAIDYRDYAAVNVYGFADGETLGKLANVYRLLASPILTAGSARFSPIRDSLKNAQEGIDSELILKVANSQREVNRMNGILQRLKEGQKRLSKIQQEIFWRNLNHLDEVLLKPYAENYSDFASEQIKVEEIQNEIKDLKKRRSEIESKIELAKETLEELRFKKAEEKSIEEIKENLKIQVKIFQQQLLTFKNQNSQLLIYNNQLMSIDSDLEKLQVEISTIENKKLVPLKDEIESLTSETLATLDKLLATNNLSEFSNYLELYIKQINDAHQQYLKLENIIDNYKKDILIIKETKNKMNNQIDERLSGALYNRAHNRLVQDNQVIHDTEIEKIDASFNEIQNQQKNILYNHPDLSVIIQRPELIKSLNEINVKLKETIELLKQKQDKYQNLKLDKKNILQQIDFLKNQMIPNFETTKTEDQIIILNNRLASLKLDPELKEKLDQTTEWEHNLNENFQNLEHQINIKNSEINAAQIQMNRLSQKLKVYDSMIRQDLKNLSPYLPDDAQLNSVDDILNFVKINRIIIKNNNFANLSSNISSLIHHNDQNGIDRYALDTIFEERGHGEIASAMRQKRFSTKNDVTVVAFDLNEAIKLLKKDEEAVIQSLKTLQTGNDVSQKTYEVAAVNRITEQYNVIKEYNQILNEGSEKSQSIRLKVELKPSSVSEQIIEEACNPDLEERPMLQKEIQQRLKRLANDTDLADDDDAFNEQAQELLDTRQWSNFRVLIKRRQNDENQYDEVDDKFVQSGGSGAEKAQAMVLPLLLVPKMLLQQANLPDAPYLVMFDEFADKLDPETAKSFAQTISHFGFSFIATMPNGAQNKILADGVENIVYEITSPANQNDGKFHKNNVHPALIWH